MRTLASALTHLRASSGPLCVALADVACRDQHLPRKDLDTINATAPDDIARWVITLNAWRLANYQPMQGIDSRMSSASTKKVGRNDPCPCGSGKKIQEMLRTQLNAATVVLTGWLRYAPNLI
jgi:hypothetical protein